MILVTETTLENSILEVSDITQMVIQNEASLIRGFKHRKFEGLYY